MPGMQKHDPSAEGILNMEARHHRRITTGREFRETLRAGPYAWPGGYQVFLYMSDGDEICFECARKNAEEILYAIRNPHIVSNDGWRVTGSDINWEDSLMICCACGKSIPASYRDD